MESISIMDKKTTLQLLSIGLVKFLFISIFIVGVSVVSTYTSRKPDGTLDKISAISKIAKKNTIMPKCNPV